MGSSSSNSRSQDNYDQSQNVSSQYGNANNIRTSGNVTITDASPEIVGKAFDFGGLALTESFAFGNNALEEAVTFGNRSQDNFLTFTEKITDSLQNSQNQNLKAIENIKLEGSTTLQKTIIVGSVVITGITLTAIFIKRK